MKNNVIDFVEFIFENSDKYYINNNELVINCNLLSVTISSDVNIKDYVKVVVSEGSVIKNKIISEYIEANEIKNLLSNVLKKIEKKENISFISTYGNNIYTKYYKSCIDVLVGKVENEYFNFSKEKEADVVNFYMEDKKSGITNCLSLNMLALLNKGYASGCITLTTSVILPVKNTDKWKSDHFSVLIPILELENYPGLELTNNKKYNKENIAEYLMETVEGEISKKSILAFQLSKDLTKKNSKVKKVKI